MLYKNKYPRRKYELKKKTHICWKSVIYDYVDYDS